jgi:hypothetical protein
MMILVEGLGSYARPTRCQRLQRLSCATKYLSLHISANQAVVGEIPAVEHPESRALSPLTMPCNFGFACNVKVQVLGLQIGLIAT